MGFFKAFRDRLTVFNAGTRTEQIISDHADVLSDQDRNMLRFYADFIGPRDICFDIGANIGDRTKVFRLLAKRTVAVEPQVACMQSLHASFGDDVRVELVHKAVSDEIGTAEIYPCEANTIASMSSAWIESVKESGRFSEFAWDSPVGVETTTLDSLIDTYGPPSFIKVDVEGYEFEVVSGLSTPVAAMSLEFTPEFLEPIERAFQHLGRIGAIEVNYALGEFMRLEWETWETPDACLRALARYKGDAVVFGDVYIRFV